MNTFENKETNDEVEIDLTQLFHLLKKNIRLIILAGVIGAVLSLVITVFFIDKKYASQARIYLTPKVSDAGVVDNATVNSNSILVNNYVSILKGENILSKVADELKLSSVEEVKAALTVSNETSTQIISVVAKTDDPTKSKKIAETTVKVFYAEMKDNLNIENMTTLDSPKINRIAVSPSKKMNTAIGAFAGVALSAGYVFLKFLLDKRLRNRNEAENFLGIPVLAEIPYYDEE